MKLEELPHLDYLPYEDKTQPDRYIPRYPKSYTRTPSQPLIRRPLTLTELTGPTGLDRKVPARDRDMSCPDLAKTRAMGQLIRVAGRVMDEEGAPIEGALIEVWQANSAGKYIHELDRHEAPLDPNFTGLGRFTSGEEGEFGFQSIKPGAYPVMETDWWWRPPHIHFSIMGPSWMSRYVTQIFFPGEALNETDLLLNSVKDDEARQRLIFQLQPTKVTTANALEYRLDFVLRGKHRTPELD
jgi:protocatechuate 3,4-dioxygenase beta subunit